MWLSTLVVVLWTCACLADQLTDSDRLQGALEAINRRQRDLADPTLYYVDHFRPAREGHARLVVPRRGEDDGQPEDIGYGYQKSIAPKTSGIFEAIPLPERELGSHDHGVESHTFNDDQRLQDIVLDYMEENMGSPSVADLQRYQYQTHNPDSKRSVFRERDVNVAPGTIQNLFPEEESPDQFFEHGEHPHVVPSSFRERLPSKPSKHHSVQNLQSLIRNFGGLNREPENYPGNDNDPDEYLSALNSVWEKYQESRPNNFDPEDLSQSDVAEILNYMSHKEETKRQHDNSYETGYDFFNSPLAWVKKSNQRVYDQPRTSNDQFFHALKFLNSNADSFEHDTDDLNDERDADEAKLLMGEQKSMHNSKRFTKRFWRGNSYDEGKIVAKRYPIAKRSSSFYTSPAAMYHKPSIEKFNQRKKKNVKSHNPNDITDPKITKELNNIFSPSESLGQESQVSEKTGGKNSTESNLTSYSTTIKATDEKPKDSKKSSGGSTSSYNHNSHSHTKRSGQKEETQIYSQHKPLTLSKKSVDWSNYFGVDKRSKHSAGKSPNDEWLLDQYLNAYSISAKATKNPDSNDGGDTDLDIDKKTSDDMDAKLRAMEDMIVDQALKYTGAHEGVVDSEEVQAVKDRVIAQLAAAYSLEKMRKALSEFKSSIAAQKASAPAHTNAPADVSDQKDKRVAVKKENAGNPPEGKPDKKEDTDNSISALHSAAGHSHHIFPNSEESCPIMDDISNRCKEIASLAGDTSEALVSLCNLHQVCYLCGEELGAAASGCDMTFLAEANNLCGDSARCRYTVRHTLAVMHSLRGDPSSLGCDWENHPCLARFMAITLR